jgi:helix-turn-helix protein
MVLCGRDRIAQDLQEDDMNPNNHATASPDDLLLLPEVAEITRRSEGTLRWLRHRGEGPTGHRAGRRIYYRRGDVMAWLAEQERCGSTPQPAA